MSTSATVTLTLKSKPKIQPLQTAPRSPSTAVKLKLTKANGQTAASARAQTPPAPAPAVPTPTAERRSPPKNDTGVTAKLVRKPSLTSSSQSATTKDRDEAVVPPPRAKVLSRFPLKRNSFDRAAFGVELKSTRDRLTSSSSSKDVKKEEAKTNGEASAVANTQSEQQSPVSADTARPPTKAETDPTPSVAMTNGTASEGCSPAAGELQTNGGSSAAVNNEEKDDGVTENGRSELMSETDRGKIVAKVANTAQIDESKKTTMTRKTLLRKSVKKKSSPTSADRLAASDVSSSVASVAPQPAQTMANGSQEERAPVPVGTGDSERSSSLANREEVVTLSAISSDGTKVMKNSNSEAVVAAGEIDREVGDDLAKSSLGATEIGSSSISIASEERVPDDFEEVSSSSTLTPAPSEERELVLSNSTITTTTASISIATTSIVSTSASIATNESILTPSSSVSGRPSQACSNVHNNMNRVSNSSDFDKTGSTSKHCSRNSIPAVGSDSVPIVDVARAADRGSTTSSAPIEPATSRPESLVQTPRLASNPINANKIPSPKIVAAAEQGAAAAAAGRPTAVETGAVPKDVASTKPPKPEGSPGVSSCATEKESVVKTAKSSTTSVIGKTLQKPLNLAQKILEAALQKSPSSSSSGSSQTTSSGRNAQPMPGTSSAIPQAAAVGVAPVFCTGSLLERAQPFVPGNLSQPTSRPSSVMANIQTVDIRNLGRLLRSPTPRPLSVLDGVDPRETELKDAFTDTASSSGVSCSLSTHSLATTIAQSRSASPESLISLSAAPSRHGSKKMEHYERGSSQSQIDQQKFEALERKQSRLESDLNDAHYSLSRERAQMLQLQEELHQMRQERNDAQQRLEASIADAVRKEKLAHRLQRELSETGAHEDTAAIEVGILKRHQTQLEEVVNSQKEDVEDLQSQLQMIREQNKHLEEQLQKQADRSTQDIENKDRELEQLRTAAHNEVAHYQKLLKECQEQRRELLRKNSELQDNRQELMEKVHEVGDQAATEKRLKRCLYRTLVLLRDARVTIEHMRATQPTRTQISKLRQKAEEADQLKEIAERAKESAVAQGEQLEQALEQVVQTRHFLQTRVDKLSQENKQLQNQVDDLAVENTDFEERYKKQVSINSSEQECREESANKIVKLEAQVETLESRLQQLRFERQVEEDSRVNSVLNSFETRTNQLELKLETEKLDKHKLQAQYNRLSDQMETARRELDAAQKREASLQITTTNQQRCLLDMRRELAEARDRNCQMRMERQTLDSQLEELIEEVRHLQTCLRVANQRIRDLEIALETTDPIQIENIMESIIEDSNSDDYEDADGGDPQGPS